MKFPLEFSLAEMTTEDVRFWELRNRKPTSWVGAQSRRAHESASLPSNAEIRPLAHQLASFVQVVGAAIGGLHFVTDRVR